MLILRVTLSPSEASAQSLREKLVAAHDRPFPLPSGSPKKLWATNDWAMVSSGNYSRARCKNSQGTMASHHQTKLGS